MTAPVEPLELVQTCFLQHPATLQIWIRGDKAWKRSYRSGRSLEEWANSVARWGTRIGLGPVDVERLRDAIIHSAAGQGRRGF